MTGITGIPAQALPLQQSDIIAPDLHFWTWKINLSPFSFG